MCESGGWWQATHPSHATSKGGQVGDKKTLAAVGHYPRWAHSKICHLSRQPRKISHDERAKNKKEATHASWHQRHKAARDNEREQRREKCNSPPGKSTICIRYSNILLKVINFQVAIETAILQSSTKSACKRNTCPRLVDFDIRECCRSIAAGEDTVSGLACALPLRPPLWRRPATVCALSQVNNSSAWSMNQPTPHHSARTCATPFSMRNTLLFRAPELEWPVGLFFCMNACTVAILTNGWASDKRGLARRF